VVPPFLFQRGLPSSFPLVNIVPIFFPLPISCNSYQEEGNFLLLLVSLVVVFRKLVPFPSPPSWFFVAEPPPPPPLPMVSPSPSQVRQDPFPFFNQYLPFSPFTPGGDRMGTPPLAISFFSFSFKLPSDPDPLPFKVTLPLLLRCLSRAALAWMTGFLLGFAFFPPLPRYGLLLGFFLTRFLVFFLSIVRIFLVSLFSGSPCPTL